jgi:hypothetical protein
MIWFMYRFNACLVIAAALLTGCSTEPSKPQPSPVEQTLPITFGGFLQNGDEHQTLDGICKTDETRTAMTCDVHNGLLQWKITELVIRISWYPYSDRDVGEYRERISIEPLQTGTVTFRLGNMLPMDARLGNHTVNRWHWLIAGAKGVRA